MCVSVLGSRSSGELSCLSSGDIVYFEMLDKAEDKGSLFSDVSSRKTIRFFFETLNLVTQLDN